VLAVDVLGRLISHAATLGILQQLHPCRHVPVMSLYADDVVLFCHPSRSDTTAIRELLHLFGHASGLHVNYGKSSAALINCTDDDIATVTTGLGCPIVELPITYLGIPLTIRRPTRDLMQLVIDRVAAKLPT
jgi:hypothetical protein